MRISYVLPGRGVSGGIRVTVQAAQLLAKRGHAVRILVGPSRGSLRARLRERYLSVRYPGRHDWLECFEGPVVEFSDLAKVPFERDEFVIAVGEASSCEIRRLDHRAAVLVQYVHGGWNRDRDLLEQAYGCSIPKLVVAPHLGSIVEEVSGQKPVAVVPNGINTSEYFPSVPEKQRDGVGLVFYTSRVKAPEVALGVLGRLRRDLPEVPQYVFGMVRRPRRVPWRSYWRLPSIERARELYSRARVWIVPSHSEGLPGPVLEAMACGAAVVSTDCGGPRYMIRDGENGFLVAVGDADGLAERVKRLLLDEALRRRIVGNAFNTVGTFTWQRSIEKLEEALCSIVRDRAT